jgi:NADP-dependent 3-hydroxy acid dehydrogenase YdfG
MAMTIFTKSRESLPVLSRERSASECEAKPPASTVKHVLVTGASSGIGAAVAARFAREGAALTLLGRHAQKLQAVAESLDARADMATVALDLTRAESISESVGRIAERLSRLDALVHAAGVLMRGTPLDDSQERFEEMMQVNVYAPMAVTRQLLPLLERAKGTIVFINSTGVQRPQRLTAQYIACKHALRSLADSLREELNARGIRVVTIFPGRTATPMQRSVHQMEGRPYQPENLLQPADIAELVACAVNLPARVELTDLFVRPRQSLATPYIERKTR